MAQRQGSGAAGGKSGTGRGFWVALAIVAVVGVGFLLRAGGSEEEAPATLSLAETTGVEADAGAGVAVGSAEAPAVVMEFSDFRCPHCKNFNAMTGRLLRQNYTGDGGPLRWVSYEFPLWPESMRPAVAARCAAGQGKYWEMHDLLFARGESWLNDDSPDKKFVGYARDLGLDGKAFESCLAESATVREIIASRKYGEQLGVNGTPTLFFNGERVTDDYSYQALEGRIIAAAEASRATQ